MAEASNLAGVLVGVMLDVPSGRAHVCNFGLDRDGVAAQAAATARSLLGHEPTSVAAVAVFPFPQFLAELRLWLAGNGIAGPYAQELIHLLGREVREVLLEIKRNIEP